MVVYRGALNPAAGKPGPVSLIKQSPTMSNPAFYQQEEQPDEYTQQLLQQAQQGPATIDYLKASLAKMQAQSPELAPGARVKAPDRTKTQPGNFQSFYQMLGSINDRGKSALAAEEARAAYRAMQEQQRLASMQAPSGMSVNSKGQYGSAYGNPIPSNPQANFKFAQQVAPQFGWNAQELQAWYTLGMKESGWRNTAQNPTSTAYGIGQFLNSTWKTVGMAKTSDPYLQVLAMAKYIQQRYGSPSRALAFHLKNNWY